MKQEVKRFTEVCESLGIELSQAKIEKFETYQKELSRWNKKINLISRSSDSPYHIFRHILDSLLIFKAVEIPSGARILDFGSGAGFPGIPVQVLRDDIRVTLLESKKKKSVFLEEMLKILKLKKAQVACGRAEDVAESLEFRHKYDVVTAKAAGNLANVASQASSFLKRGGLLVAYKGTYAKDEMEKLRGLKQFEVRDEASFQIAEYDLTRKLLVSKKK